MQFGLAEHPALYRPVIDLESAGKETGLFVVVIYVDYLQEIQATKLVLFLILNDSTVFGGSNLGSRTCSLGKVDPKSGSLGVSPSIHIGILFVLFLVPIDCRGCMRFINTLRSAHWQLQYV